MAAMRLTILSAAAFLLSGCGAYYDEVPAFGESDPNQVAAQERVPQQQQPQQGTVAAIGADNQSQDAVDPGQPVNADDASQDYGDTDPSALTEFKSTLDPYGTWSDDNQYGTVWQPDPGVVGSDFAPYVTGGHWGYDDNQYVWASDYDWGWAPFHYGRWVYIAGRGWCWIPGRRYAGAWVTWRTGVDGYGYVGWGPMSPSWYWRGGRAYGIGWGVSTPYTFCRSGDLFSPSLHGRIVAGPDVTVVANNTRPYTDGRTPAHPTVGPPPNHIGAVPPPFERNAAYMRARALARVSTTPGAPGQIRTPQSVPFTAPRIDRPVATAPRFNGVMPQPYRPPMYQRPYYNAPPSYSGPPAYRGPQTIGGGSPYHTYNMAPPSYRMAPSAPVYRGGGGFSGGQAYHPPSTSSYTHSHSSGGVSHGGGGRGGHR